MLCSLYYSLETLHILNDLMVGSMKYEVKLQVCVTSCEAIMFPVRMGTHDVTQT